MSAFDINRAKLVVKLARCLVRLNETSSYIDVVEFSRLLGPEDAFLFLERYCFHVQLRKKNRDRFLK